MKVSQNYEEQRDRWRVEWRIVLEGNVIRKRKFFKDRNESDRFTKELRNRLEEEGMSGMNVDVRKWREVLYLEDLLGSRGTLREAVEFFITSGCQKQIQIPMAVKEYLAQYGGGKLNKCHVQGILKKFQKLDTQDGSMIRNWILGLKLAAETKDGYRRVIRAFFSWMKKSGQIREIPPLLDQKITFLRRKPVALDVETVSRILTLVRQLDPSILPFLILKLFAGLRTSTATRLEWKHIEMGSGISIPANLAKSGSETFLEGHPEILWRLLNSVKDQVLGRLKTPRILGKLLESQEIDLPKNIFRHTFASYHFTRFKDAPLTSFLLEHEGRPSVLFRHYRGTRTLSGELVKLESSKEFFDSPSV